MEGRGQRSEAREAPPASSTLEALCLRHEILPSHPGRCPRREVRGQEAELKIRASAPGAGPVPSPNPTAGQASRSKMLGPPTRGGAPEPPRLQGTHPKSSCHIRQDSEEAEAWVGRGQRGKGKKRRQTQRKRDGWGRSWEKSEGEGREGRGVGKRGERGKGPKRGQEEQGAVWREGPTPPARVHPHPLSQTGRSRRSSTREGAFPEHRPQPAPCHRQPRPRGFSLNNPGSSEPEDKPGPWRKERQGWDGAQERRPLPGGKVALTP